MGRYTGSEADRPTIPGPSPIDLHSHTRRSDGILEPVELVTAAAAVGVSLLSITDHDTLAAFRELTGPDAPALPTDLQLIPGVEINSVAESSPELWEAELHILGFGVDPWSDAFEASLAAQRERRRARFSRTIARLRDLGLSVDDLAAQLPPDETIAVGRPTLARWLVAKGHATSVDDAFRRILGRGQPGYLPRSGLGPREAIEAIRAAGGVAVLAHFWEAEARRSIVAELASYGLRGLEVYYRAFDALTVASVGQVARDLALVATGGSDYHGDDESYAEAHAELWVPPEVGRALAAALEREPSKP